MDKYTNPWDKPIAWLDAENKRIEQMQRDSIAQARREGTTWDQIGHALRITRQAAQQRFGKFCD